MVVQMYSIILNDFLGSQRVASSLYVILRNPTAVICVLGVFHVARPTLQLFRLSARQYFL